jgi:hypothetical protein
VQNKQNGSQTQDDSEDKPETPTTL